MTRTRFQPKFDTGSLHQNIDPLADTLRMFGGHGFKEKLTFKQIQVFLSLMEGEITLTTEYHQEYIGDLGRVTTQIRALQKHQFVQHVGHGRYRVTAMAKTWLKHFRESDDYPKFLQWVEVARTQREARRGQASPHEGHRRLTPMEEHLNQQKAERERLRRTHEEHDRIIRAYKVFIGELTKREALQPPDSLFPDDPPASHYRPMTVSDREFDIMIQAYGSHRSLWLKIREAAARRLSKLPPTLIDGPATPARLAIPTATLGFMKSRQTVLEFARDYPTARALFRSTRDTQKYFDTIATLDCLGVPHPYPRPTGPIQVIDLRTLRPPRR